MEGSKSREGAGERERKTGVYEDVTCYTADLDDAGRGQEPREHRQPPEARKGKETDPSLELLERTQSCQHSDTLNLGLLTSRAVR